MVMFGPQRAPTRGVVSKIQQFSTVVLPVLAAVLCGYVWGAAYPRLYRDMLPASRSRPQSSELRLRSVSTLFDYNATFSQAPSAVTNKAWKGLFPKQAGYFRHPELAPDRATFSAFHQLHCIDGIRHGYWALYDVAISQTAIDPDDLPMMATPAHIRHCIELLRRSVMCQPDLTIEAKDEKVGGVNGFGVVHECKDWEQLKEWTSRWEAWGQTDKDGKGLVVGGHSHKPEDAVVVD